jgi:hypothetical protein
MIPLTKPVIAVDGYELIFADLFNQGYSYVFPCDALGHVDMDTLSECARNNYFYARVVVGNSLSAPFVHAIAPGRLR